jgi:hypothetical protein
MAVGKNSYSVAQEVSTKYLIFRLIIFHSSKARGNIRQHYLMIIGANKFDESPLDEEI